jgi:hypothetical protein
MPLDYHALSEDYNPKKKITKLLIGECPPHNGKTYFYLPAVPVREISMPSTIFQHYIGRNPQTIPEYQSFLEKLFHNGIFLMDICDEPLHIANHDFPGWVDPVQLEILKSRIPKLKEKIVKRQINISEVNIIFLPARNKYNTQIHQNFPASQIISWANFRRSRELLKQKY